MCPDELKEAISGLLYASTRCGEFPELQEICAAFTSRYGKEFVASAIELRNHCRVNPKVCFDSNHLSNQAEKEFTHFVNFSTTR